MKFDVILMNPPFNKDMYLDFMVNSFNCLSDVGNMVIIHPSTWLIKLAESKTNIKYNAIKEMLNEYVKSVDIEMMNDKFNIAMFVPLSIMHINKSHKYDKIFYINHDDGKFVNSLYECNLIGDYEIIKSINAKVRKRCHKSFADYIYKHKQQYNSETAFLRYCQILGSHRYKLDGGGAVFFDKINNLIISGRYVHCLFHKYDYTPVRINEIGTTKSKNKNMWQCVYCNKFDNFEDNKKFLENFVYFASHTKFAHYIGITYLHSSNNTVLPYVPYLDFSHKWTDEMINEYFEFNTDEINLIKNTCDKFEWYSDWYQKYSEYKND